MKAIRNFLSQFPDYTPQILEDVIPLLSTKTLKAGEYLLRHGKVSKHIAFVDQGLLRLFYLNEGKEITNCFCKENGIATSYSSLITQKESEFAIQAIEDTTVTILSYHSLQELYKTHPFWQQLGRIAAENEYISTENHHHFIRNRSATERYLQVLEKDRELFFRVPLNYLASYLQITPETLSRIRKKLSTNLT